MFVEISYIIRCDISKKTWQSDALDSLCFQYTVIEPDPGNSIVGKIRNVVRYNPN